MQDVAIFELMLGRSQNLLARHRRRNLEQCQNILQLIAKAKCPARLIKTGTPKNSRCDGLIQQPSIKHYIHRRLGGFDANLIEQIIPKCSEVDPRLFYRYRFRKARNEL